MYALLAKARGTDTEHERLAAEEDGFDKLLDEWVAVAEQRQNALETSDRSKDGAEQNNDASQATRRLLDEQVRIQERDERFDQAFSLFDTPPDAQP